MTDSLAQLYTRVLHKMCYSFFFVIIKCFKKNVYSLEAKKGGRSNEKSAE